MTVTRLLNAATWHQRRADNKHLSTDVRNRHDVIAYRLFIAAHIIGSDYNMGAA